MRWDSKRIPKRDISPQLENMTVVKYYLIFILKKRNVLHFPRVGKFDCGEICLESKEKGA